MQFSTLMWLSRRINDVGLHFRSWWDHLKSLKPPYHQEKACKQTETSIGLSKDRKDLAVIKCSVVEIRWKATARKHVWTFMKKWLSCYKMQCGRDQMEGDSSKTSCLNIQLILLPGLPQFTPLFSWLLGIRFIYHSD